MEKILRGVSKFQREVFPKEREAFERLAKGQEPEALFITCSDSRVVPSVITQTGPGDLFLCRNAGNIVPPFGGTQGGISATIEYAICALGVRHVIVCGHTHCGAMKGLLHPDALVGMPTVKRWLSYGEVARRVVAEAHPNSPEETKLRLVTEQNVIAQLQNLRTHPSVAVALAHGRLQLHGWVYYIETGQVIAWDEALHSFVSIEDYQPASTAGLALAG